MVKELRQEWENFCNQNMKECLHNEDTIFFLEYGNKIYLFLGEGRSGKLHSVEEEFFFWDEKEAGKVISKKWTELLRKFENGTKQKYLIYGGKSLQSAPFFRYWSFNSFKSNFPFPVLALYDEGLDNIEEICRGIMKALNHVRAFYRKILRLPFRELKFYFDFQDVGMFPPNNPDSGESLWVVLLKNIAKDLGAVFFENHKERLEFFKNVNIKIDLFISFYHDCGEHGLQCSEKDFLSKEIFQNRMIESMNPVLGLHCEGSQSINKSTDTFSIFNSGKALQWEYLMFVSKIFREAIMNLPEDERDNFSEKLKYIDIMYKAYTEYLIDRIGYGYSDLYAEKISQIGLEFEEKGYFKETRR